MEQQEASPETPTAAHTVNAETFEGFYTPVAMRPTIQPERRCPPITRARHRVFALKSAVAHEDPGHTEDITAVDDHTNLHDTIDNVITPLQRAHTGPPTRVPVVERWYTVSPPTSDGGHGVPPLVVSQKPFRDARY